MRYLPRRNDALIFFVITGVKFLVSDQVISGVSILSYMCRFFLLSISLIWYLNYNPEGAKRAFRGGWSTPFMRQLPLWDNSRYETWCQFITHPYKDIHTHLRRLVLCNWWWRFGYHCTSPAFWSLNINMVMPNLICWTLARLWNLQSRNYLRLFDVRTTFKGAKTRKGFALELNPAGTQRHFDVVCLLGLYLVTIGIGTCTT